MNNDIEATAKVIENTLNTWKDEELENDYPLLKFEEIEFIEFLLVHLLGHLQYHLGQINYHRRIFNKK